MEERQELQGIQEQLARELREMLNKLRDDYAIIQSYVKLSNKFDERDEDEISLN